LECEPDHGPSSRAGPSEIEEAKILQALIPTAAMAG
jgi:hypothetical protein